MSDDGQKTADDIIDSMERFADRHWMHDEGQSVREFAARLRAALKRERAEHTCECGEIAVLAIKEAEKPQGNAAAMREALIEIDRVVFDKRRHTKEEVEAHRLATEALTVPARNCDLFNNPEDAYEAWKKECNRVKNVNGCCRNCPYDTYKADSEKPSCVDMFLFAPAAERKGEGDAR